MAVFSVANWPSPVAPRPFLNKMYKRQDWLHLHGQNAAEASSSDSEAEKTGA